MAVHTCYVCDVDAPPFRPVKSTAALHQPAPAPQSAVEWVKERIITIHDDLDQECEIVEAKDALELARRCDEAKKIALIALRDGAKTRQDRNDLRAQLAAAQARYEKQCEGTHSRMSEIVSLRQQLTDTQTELARLQHESTAHRVAWENAEARERGLREVLGWYAGELRFCNAISREGDESRNRLAKDHGNRAVEALAKNKEAQP